MCCFPIFNVNLGAIFPVRLRRHVYLRGALPPPGTEGYFLLTDEEDRYQVIFSAQPHRLSGPDTVPSHEESK